MRNFLSPVAGSFSSLWPLVLNSVASILWAVIIVAFGFLFSSWVERLVIKLLIVVKADDFSKKVGLESFLKKADFKLSFSGLVATSVRWVLIFAFVLTALDFVGLNQVSQVLFSILSYIPNIIAAVFVFALGFFVAGLVQGLVKGALVSFDKKVARSLSNFARWLILIIAFFASLDQLKIAQSLVNNFFQGLAYTFVLAFGLSFGLGAKDLVSKILNDWYEKLKK